MMAQGREYKYKSLELNNNGFLSRTMRTLFNNKLIILFGVSFCILGTSCDMKEYPCKMLPSSAKNIHEYSWESSFPPDYCYLLKAEIPEDDFIKYKDKMGFVEYNGTREVDWSGFEDVGEWWNPSDSNEPVYYDPSMKGSGKAYMKYENGLLYYKESVGI